MRYILPGAGWYMVSVFLILIVRPNLLAGKSLQNHLETTDEGSEYLIFKAQNLSPAQN